MLLPLIFAYQQKKAHNFKEIHILNILNPCQKALISCLILTSQILYVCNKINIPHTQVISGTECVKGRLRWTENSVKWDVMNVCMQKGFCSRPVAICIIFGVSFLPTLYVD